MKIHLQSDTHIEMGPTLQPAVVSDLTICAGDNGLLSNTEALKKYFGMIRETTDEIIWVLGNHEFYHSNYHDALEVAEKFAKENGIHLLDEALGTANLELGGIKFWGSTLWTDLKEADFYVVKRVGHGMNDYHVITKSKDGNDVGFTAHDTMEINRRTKEQINWDADFVITHHCPMVIKHKHFPLNDFTYGFCNTGLDQQIRDSKIKYWAYGHTHDSRSIDVNGTTILSNQQGYVRGVWEGDVKYEDAGYDPRLILEI